MWGTEREIHVNTHSNRRPSSYIFVFFFIFFPRFAGRARARRTGLGGTFIREQTGRDKKKNKNIPNGFQFYGHKTRAHLRGSIIEFKFFTHYNGRIFYMRYVFVTFFLSVARQLYGAGNFFAQRN